MKPHPQTPEQTTPSPTWTNDLIEVLEQWFVRMGLPSSVGNAKCIVDQSDLLPFIQTQIEQAKAEARAEVVNQLIKEIEGLKKKEIEQEFIAKGSMTFMGVETITKGKTYKYKSAIDEDDKIYNQALQDVVKLIKEKYLN